MQAMQDPASLYFTKAGRLHFRLACKDHQQPEHITNQTESLIAAAHLELKDGALAARALRVPAKQLQQRAPVAVLQRSQLLVRPAAQSLHMSSNGLQA
jgi:hypothetical protein